LTGLVESLFSKKHSLRLKLRFSLRVRFLKQVEQSALLREEVTDSPFSKLGERTLGVSGFCRNVTHRGLLEESQNVFLEPPKGEPPPNPLREADVTETKSGVNSSLDKKHPANLTEERDPRVQTRNIKVVVVLGWKFATGPYTP